MPKDKTRKHPARPRAPRRTIPSISSTAPVTTPTAANATSGSPPLPHLMKVDEVAELLRTTRKAVYASIQRGALPGVVRLPRRLLIDRAVLLEWLQQRCAVSLTNQGDQR